MVRRLLFAATVSLVCIGLLELLARVVLREAALASIPDELVRAHVTNGDIVYDPVLGWKRSKLPDGPLGLDSHGFRHPEVSVEKPAGRKRGFTLGDSQTFGAGVLATQSYAAVAEARLRAGGLDVEVINAGLSGYSSQQAWRLLQTKLVAFDPDFLIVDCRAGDSEQDDATAFDGGGLAGIEPLLFYSRLYRALRLGVAWLQPDAPVKMRPPPGNHANLALPGNHLLFQRWGEANGVDIWFLDYPFVGNPVVSLAPPDRLPPGAHTIPATAALLASGRSGPELFLDNNHMSALGNRITGETIAATLGPGLGGR